MGTDIHLKMQKRVDGTWLDMAPQWPTYPFPKDDEGNMIWPEDDPTCRSYNVFALIAGVRNGTGFAGVPTHKPIEPIAANRGWPEDLDPKHDQHDYSLGDPPEDHWYPGDHSFTWASIAELRKADWGRAIDAVGIARAHIWDAFIEDPDADCPGSWCGGVGGRDVVIMNADEYAKAKQAGTLPKGDINVRGSWTWNPLKRTGFYTWLFGDRVNTLIEEHGLENLRLLIGFDS